jgi:hypothetical protein
LRTNEDWSNIERVKIKATEGFAYLGGLVPFFTIIASSITKALADLGRLAPFFTIIASSITIYKFVRPQLVRWLTARRERLAAQRAVRPPRVLSVFNFAPSFF